MVGEKGYLLSYDRLTDDELLEQYLKFEPDLLIYDDYIRQSEQAKRDAEKDANIAKLEAQIEFLMAKEKAKELVH